MRLFVLYDLSLSRAKTFSLSISEPAFSVSIDYQLHNLHRSLLNIPNRIPFDSIFLDTVITMLMESQCMGGGGSHNGNVAPHHHQQSMGHFQFRDRKKSCGTPPSSSSPSPSSSSSSSGRLPAFARFHLPEHHLHHPGTSSVMSGIAHRRRSRRSLFHLFSINFYRTSATSS
ncbi:hypothetical protein B9Z55_001437 [Caenorhabditis nigoni]|uniref:Uncharacterized protein n=1 Tax=Caenorhabditis nigoni TaxID=1611254 RepID=A0A2G5VFP6_9PELO|nr:hypothetical protein B9Z55_001437 [Caenorhabditis nigoni]